MRGLEGRKLGLALIVAQMASLALGGASRAPASEGGAGRGAWTRVYIAPAFRPTLRGALDGAVFLGEPVTWLDGPPDRRELVETVAAVLRELLPT